MGPYSFDEEFGGEDDEQVEPDAAPPTNVERIVAQLAQPQSSEDEEELDDNYMHQVDERLEVTTHYRILLQGSLFDSDSPAARIVEKEVRRFVRNRVEILLGIRREAEVHGPAAPVSLPFTEAEITALKALAGAAMRSPSLGGQEKKVEPQVRVAQVPVAKALPALSPRTPKPGPVAKAQPSPVAPKPAAAPIPAKTPPSKGGRKRGYIRKQAVDRDGNPIVNDEGKPVMTTAVQQQNPEGRLPWPTDQGMEMLTHDNATRSVGTTTSGKIAAALVSGALKNPNT